jgi:ABC-type xylose transport system permease subunit
MDPCPFGFLVWRSRDETLARRVIMTIVDNGCTQLGLENWVQQIVTGAIIVGAVTLDRLRHRRPA